MTGPCHFSAAPLLSRARLSFPAHRPGPLSRGSLAKDYELFLEPRYVLARGYGCGRRLVCWMGLKRRWVCFNKILRVKSIKVQVARVTGKKNRVNYPRRSRCTSDWRALQPFSLLEYAFLSAGALPLAGAPYLVPQMSSQSVSFLSMATELLFRISCSGLYYLFFGCRVDQ